MTFREHSAGRICQRHGDRSAVFESKHEGRADEIADILVRRDIDRTFNSMSSGDWHSIPRERLVSGDPVADVLEPVTTATQISDSRVFLDKSHADRILP